jgi:hypothetical protein
MITKQSFFDNQNPIPNFFLVLVNLLCLYVFLLMFIETTNGVFLHKNINAINQLLSAGKLFITFLALYFLSIVSRREFTQVFVFLSVGFFVVFVHQLFGLDDDLRSLNIIFKITFCFLCFFLYKFLIAQTTNGVFLVELILKMNFFVLLSNIFLGAAGIGFANYTSADETAIGGTGFLYAGNEVGISLLLAFSSMLVVYSNNLQRLILLISITFISSLFVLSKVSLIGVTAAIFSFLYFSGKGRFLVGLCIFATSIVSTYPLWIGYFQLAINRWTFLLKSYGIEAFILGGHKRVEYIADYLQLIGEKPYLLFLGIGWVGEAENNFFDMVEGFGLLGLVVFLCWAYLLLKFWFNRPLNTTHLELTSIKTAVVISTMSIVVVILAGHGIQSLLTVPFYGFIPLISAYLIRRQELNSKIHFNEVS